MDTLKKFNIPVVISSIKWVEVEASSLTEAIVHLQNNNEVVSFEDIVMSNKVSIKPIDIESSNNFIEQRFLDNLERLKANKKLNKHNNVKAGFSLQLYSRKRMSNYKLVSSFYWYQLPQLIQLLEFMEVTDYSITIDDMSKDLGFNLYVLAEVKDSATKIIARAEHFNWFTYHTVRS